MSTTRKVLKEIVERFERMERLVSSAFLRYERVEDWRTVVRANEVGQAVADLLQEENSPLHRAELAAALKAIGVRRVTRHHVAYYRGMRLRKR